MDAPMTFHFPKLTATEISTDDAVELLKEHGRLRMKERHPELPFFVARVEGSATERHEIHLPLWEITSPNGLLNINMDGYKETPMLRPILHVPDEEYGFRYYIPMQTVQEVLRHHLEWYKDSTRDRLRAEIPKTFGRDLLNVARTYRALQVLKRPEVADGKAETQSSPPYEIVDDESDDELMGGGGRALRCRA
ncbi:MAG: hypothetical protein Q9226_006427 [Calogaya cf. arnoldii]